MLKTFYKQVIFSVFLRDVCMCVIILIILQSVNEIIILCRKQNTLDLILDLIQATVRQSRYELSGTNERIIKYLQYISHSILLAFRK